MMILVSYSLFMTLLLAKIKLPYAIVNAIAAIFLFILYKSHEKKQKSKHMAEFSQDFKDLIVAQKQALFCILRNSGNLTKEHKELLELTLDSNQETLDKINMVTVKYNR